MEALKFGSFNVSCDHGCTTFARQLDAGRTPFRINGIDSAVRSASAGIVAARSDASPPSSDGCTSSLSWVMNGRLASIAGPAETTPGMRALASVSTGGSAALTAFSAGTAVRSVFGSSATAFSSATFSRANACAVVLKSVTRLWRLFGCATSAPATVPCAAIHFDRSWGWIPSALWATIDEFL